MSKIFSDNYLIDSISNSITSNLNAWLAHHPFLSWLINHPLISICIGLITLVLIIRLFLTIYRVIASFIDKIWLWILRSPFLLIKFLFGWEAKSKTIPATTTITNYEVNNDLVQLGKIMDRLDIIQQQQKQILQDIEQLKQQGQIANLKPINLSKQQLTSNSPKLNKE